MNIIFSSFGNDSLALIQWAIDNKLDNVVVAYSNTKWGRDDWQERVDTAREWLKGHNITTAIISSEGFENLVRRKKAFPTNGMAFCSYELKIAPAMRWLDLVNPGKTAKCYTGVMRIESEARKNWPEVIESSENHGGRMLISPMASFTEAQRDELLSRTPFDKLQHRSAECWPCVNANKKDIQMVEPERIRFIDDFEKSMGVGVRSGNPKYMFRASKHGGAAGAQQVYDRACSGARHYSPDQDDLFGCDSGFCGI